MSHTLLHQMLVSDLVVPVGLAHGPGQEYLTAFGTRLSDDTWLRPDLMVFREEQAESDLWYIRGAPLLAIEVVSPASHRADLEVKKALYERYGVPSYWLVDVVAPEPALIVHELDASGRYAALTIPWDGSRVLSRPFAIELAPKQIFDPLPARMVPTRRGSMSEQSAVPSNPVQSETALEDVVVAERTFAGPDLPHCEDPILLDAFGHRWPTGAEKVELWDGCPVFYGEWDDRDVEIAQRAYPGRVVRLDQPAGEPGTMTILPGPGEWPRPEGAAPAAEMPRPREAS